MPKIRKSYDVRKKLEIVKWHREHGSNVSATSREFGIDRKQVREWCQKNEELLQHNHGQAKFKRKLSLGRPVLSEEMDDSLFEFFEKQRKDGLAVSNRHLADEAQNVAKELGLLDFKASCQYLKRWKIRFNVSMRQGTNDSQKLPEDYIESVQAFSAALRTFREKNGYSDYSIGNMDETMVRFDSTTERTNNVKGESTIRIANTGCKKRGFTVALTARASGHKMPAFLIFKEPSGRIPPKAFAALLIPSNIRVSSSLNGWMTSEKMQEWFSRVWGGNEDDVRRLLVLDLAPVHKTAAALAAIAKSDSDVVMIPAGCTGFLQPADVSWNKPFKDALRKSWALFMNKRQKTPKGNLKKPSRQDMINFVSEAWSSVTEDTVERSFKACGISSALDGSESGLFNSRLAEVGLVCARGLQQEATDLMFASDSEESFDGFSDDE